MISVISSLFEGNEKGKSFKLIVKFCRALNSSVEYIFFTFSNYVRTLFVDI